MDDSFHFAAEWNYANFELSLFVYFAYAYSPSSRILSIHKKFNVDDNDINNHICCSSDLGEY